MALAYLSTVLTLLVLMLVLDSLTASDMHELDLTKTGDVLIFLFRAFTIVLGLMAVVVRVYHLMFDWNNNGRHD